MLPVSVLLCASDELSLKLLPPMLIITSTSSSDSSINYFNKTFFCDLDFFFFPFAFICFSSLQFLEHRFLRNNLNKKLHPCTITNRKSYCTANMNRLRRLYICVRIHLLYVHIYSKLVPRTFCFSNIRRREISRLLISERQDALGIRLYIQQYTWIFYFSS